MKTLILTDQEFNKLYEVFEPTYIALKGRVAVSYTHLRAHET